MPQDLTVLMPKIIARGLMSLRGTCMAPQLVNGDYSADAAEFGNTIDVPIPVAQAAVSVSPSNTPPAPADTTPTKASISLSNWKKTDFKLTDKDMKEIDGREKFLPSQTVEAIIALSDAVNTEIFSHYKKIFGYTGTAGTTPFGSSDSDAVNLRKVLAQQKCPKVFRRAVVDLNAEANMLALPSFKDVSQTGQTSVKLDGEVGRKFGIDWYAEDNLPTHTSTPLTAGAATVNGAHNAGVTTVSIAKATNTSPLVAGDILVFSGDSQTYAVQADVTLAVGNTNVTIYPGLKVAKSGGETVSLKASHVVNIGFHRDCFAFANRPLNDAAAVAAGAIIQSMQDPLTGIAIRLEVNRQYKQTVWEFDILWGSECVRPEMGARLAG